MPDFHVTFRDLLHALYLRRGTNGFTSLPKEGALRIFLPWKIRLLRPDLNQRTCVPKASTLPLDHRSRLNTALISTNKMSSEGSMSRLCKFATEPNAEVDKIIFLLLTYFFNNYSNYIFPFMRKSPSRVFPSDLPTKTYINFSFLPFRLNVPPITFPSFDCPLNILQGD